MRQKRNYDAIIATIFILNSRQKLQAAWAANWIVISDCEQRLEIVLKFSNLPLLKAPLV